MVSINNIILGTMPSVILDRSLLVRDSLDLDSCIELIINIEISIIPINIRKNNIIVFIIVNIIKITLYPISIS